MKVAVVSPFYPPDITGSSLFSKNLAEYFAEQGHEVVVLTPSHQQEKESRYLNGIKIVRLSSVRFVLGKLSYSYAIPFISLKFGFINLWSQLAKLRPDVMHIHGQMFDLALIGFFYSRLQKIPVIITVHSPFTHTNRWLDKILRLLDLLLIKPMLTKAERIVSVDRQTRYYLQSSCPKLKTIEIGVSAPSYLVKNGNKERLIKENPKILKDHCYVVSLGHVVPMRNRKTLVDAVSELTKFNERIQLIIVGNVYDKSIYNFEGTKSLGERIMFTGAVNPSEIKDYLDLADVECHDLQGIGIGLTSIEAMQAEIPTILCVPADNWRDINLDDYSISRIETNDTNLIREELLKLISDPGYAQQVIDEQNRLLENFLDFKEVARRYENLYRELISEHCNWNV